MYEGLFFHIEQGVFHFCDFLPIILTHIILFVKTLMLRFSCFEYLFHRLHSRLFAFTTFETPIQLKQRPCNHEETDN